MTGFAMMAIGKKAIAYQRRVGNDQRLAAPQFTQFGSR